MNNPSSTSSAPGRWGQVLIRQVLLLLGGLLLVFSPHLFASAPPTLYVFANADMRANALEKHLESQLPGVDVTVFSRIRGFETALGDRPDGFLARKPVLESLGLRPELQGYLGGKATEPFVLVSANSPVTPAELNGKTVGAVNIMGRREMEEFVKGLLGGVSPKVKNVTHERDLLALLQFQAADAVLVSEAWATRFQQKSEMNLKTTHLPSEVGLPAVAFGSGGNTAVLTAKIKAAGPSFNEALGVTQWR